MNQLYQKLVSALIWFKGHKDPEVVLSQLYQVGHLQASLLKQKKIHLKWIK